MDAHEHACPDSFAFVVNGQAYVKSEAALRCSCSTPGQP
jgi:hypothetical protein